MTNYDWPFGTLALDFLAQIWTQGTLRHILGPILIIFEICQFLMIPGLFQYFSENGWSQKISFLNEGVIIWALISLDLGGEVPRGHGPICSQSETLGGCYGLSKVEYHFFDTLMKG